MFDLHHNQYWVNIEKAQLVIDIPKESSLFSRKDKCLGMSIDSKPDADCDAIYLREASLNLVKVGATVSFSE